MAVFRLTVRERIVVVTPTGLALTQIVRSNRDGGHTAVVPAAGVVLPRYPTAYDLTELRGVLASQYGYLYPLRTGNFDSHDSV